MTTAVKERPQVSQAAEDVYAVCARAFRTVEALAERVRDGCGHEGHALAVRAFDLRDAAREQGPECLATFDKAWQERSDEDFHALSDCETLAHINEAYGGIVALLADKVDDRESLLFWEIVRVIDDWRRAFEKAMPDWCADNIGEDDAGKDGAA